MRYRPRRRQKCGSARRWWTRRSRKDARAMCWRQVSRFQKTLLALALYLTLYVLVSLALAPAASVSFVSDELRIGDKYVLMFLVAPHSPLFSDSDGAEVFASRRCGRCFITNNKGMLPMREYDAVLVFGERSLLSQTMAVMDPGRRYLLEARKRCLRNKLRRCFREPRLTAFGSRETYDLCGLCRRLHAERNNSLM
ncbi:hypothetical protein PYW07_005483 [Mythimna separata]|uniref:Uncharacterized protein n=1 Tax=Mythimna separata TaxID=271217 RepID=A0AAD8DQQ7_MYTSE|nr:hypothetical protein PYW07_005483 [Mythimna separata]